MPTVSVIITCYNHGTYLDDAVNSVLAQSYNDYEIIVVNDGSTALATNRLLVNYSRPRLRILKTENRGLAEARNFGIRNSTGKYILPLDSDDTIASSYLEWAVPILEQHSNIKIVYGKARLFGERNEVFKLTPFAIDEMLVHNQIFCTAFFRRSDFDATQGYDPGMKGGWEDWDFWLTLLEQGGEVYQIPETVFFYRIRHDSMAASLTPKMKESLRKRIFENHEELYRSQFHIFARKYYLLLDSPDLKLGRYLLKPIRSLMKMVSMPGLKKRLPWEWPEE
ncbi:MAG: glycosyltransferase family A protein [Candidatus Omnitrophota bacterium]|nr:glycosyltransferase family A protein [Candidatus Omnitrophota bacterium]